MNKMQWFQFNTVIYRNPLVLKWLDDFAIEFPIASVRLLHHHEVVRMVMVDE